MFAKRALAIKKKAALLFNEARQSLGSASKLFLICTTKEQVIIHNISCQVTSYKRIGLQFYTKSNVYLVNWVCIVKISLVVF